jgi:hypothetical protein
VDDPDGEELIEEDDTEELYRLGVAYDFDFGRAYALASTFAVDFVDDEEVYVYGVVLFRHF